MRDRYKLRERERVTPGYEASFILYYLMVNGRRDAFSRRSYQYKYYHLGEYKYYKSKYKQGTEDYGSEIVCFEWKRDTTISSIREA